jgi:Ca2+-binding EF-hand superfamily protein
VQICLDNYTDFILALSKTFKRLDTFNRGTIDLTNINSKIPQYTLKFLDKIFKKIKEDQLTITEKQFVKMCEPLLKESTNTELMSFLNAFSAEETILKQSINFTNSSKHMFSPI